MTYDNPCQHPDHWWCDDDIYLHTHHPTRINGIWVDKKIATLITQIWALGYKTRFSCQDIHGEGTAQIVFESIEEAARYLTHIYTRSKYHYRAAQIQALAPVNGVLGGELLFPATDISILERLTR